jgi:hypothetical protein
MNTLADGSGTNITADLTVTATFYSTTVEFELLNANTSLGWATFLQCRGTPIYIYNPIEYFYDDDQSQDEHGISSISIGQCYRNTVNVSINEIESIVEVEKNSDVEAFEVSFVANSSKKLMATFLQIDIGDYIHLDNTRKNIDNNYFVWGKRWTISQGGIIVFTLMIKRLLVLALGLSLLKVEFDGVDQLLRYPSRSIMQSEEVTIIANIDLDAFGAATNPNIIVMYESERVIYRLFLSSSSTQKFAFEAGFTVDGRWATDDSSLGTGESVLGVSYSNADLNNDPKLYLDGSSLNVNELLTPLGSLDIISNSSIVEIGGGSFSNVFFDGHIWNVRWYNRILTDEASHNQ